MVGVSDCLDLADHFRFAAVTGDLGVLTVSEGPSSILIQRWSVPDCALLGSRRIHQTTFSCADFAPATGFLAVGCPNGVLKLWHITEHAVSCNLWANFARADQAILSCRFSHDGTKIAYASGHDVSVRDTRSGAVLATLNICICEASQSAAPQLLWSTICSSLSVLLAPRTAYTMTFKNDTQEVSVAKFTTNSRNPAVGHLSMLGKRPDIEVVGESQPERERESEPKRRAPRNSRRVPRLTNLVPAPLSESAGSGADADAEERRVWSAPHGSADDDFLMFQ